MTFTATPRRGLAAIGLSAIAVLAVGCTSVVNSGGDAASGEPTEGGTISVSMNGDFQPGQILALRGGNTPWVRNVFEPLTMLDEDNVPQPVLATDWEFSVDNMSVTINLRDDVVFHSGRPMTADDVIWTFEKTTDPTSGSQVGFIAANFAEMTALSDTSLEIDFTQPVTEPSLADYFEQTYIVDSETYDSLADGSDVIGTGPYTWADYDPGVSVTIERNDDWWGDEPQYLDAIEFDRMTDSTAQISALRSGRSDVTYGLSLLDVKSFADDPAYTITNTGGTQYVFGVDATQAPFDDVRVRQALQFAIDRDRINQQVFAGAATPTDLFWNPGAEGVTEEQEQFYTYDPDKARELLEEAGATGAEVPITVVALPPIQSEYEIIANNLTEVGLKPVAVPVDETTFNSLQNQADLGPAFLLLHGQVGFGETTMLNSLPSLRANNPSHFDTPEYQELRQALLTADADGTPEALSALTDYMLDEAWALPILQAPGQFVTDADVIGVATTKRGAPLYASAAISE